MTKADKYMYDMIKRILAEGTKDVDPRPKYADGTPAHTYFVNHTFRQYDLSKGEFPICTLRPMAWKTGIREIFTIYQKPTNNIAKMHEMGVNWWDEWDIGNRTIGSVYGETVRRHELVKKLIDGIKNNPDGRRHIISLWQEDVFKDKHGLKPCAFLTQWNVRHGNDGVDYLDMCLTQRSSDFCTAGCINQVQYLVFQHLIARHLGLVPGRFTWFYNNIQIYDRHIEQAKELINREPVSCEPEIWLNPEKTNFYDFTPDDIEVRGYPRKLIKERNPQMKFEIGIQDGCYFNSCDWAE